MADQVRVRGVPQQSGVATVFSDKPTMPHAVDITDVALSGARDIIDIRQDREDISLAKDIHKGLQVAAGLEKTLPTLLLYDEAGLKLFEDITYLDEYYLTNSEISLLEEHAASIAEHVESGSIIVELGSGNLRKVDILLKAIDRIGKDVEYYALDLSLRELQRTLAAIPKGSYSHVQCFGLHGTYDDGLAWLQKPMMKVKRKLIMSIGSSLGNFSRTDAADFLKGFVDALDPKDAFLIALDGCKDPEKVYRAYNDRDGITHKFISNGLVHANEVLRKTAFDPPAWQALGEYNAEAGRHQAFVSPRQDTIVEGVFITKDEKIRIEESHKYSDDEVKELWQSAGVDEIMRWTTRTTDPYSMYLLSKRGFAFQRTPEQYAPSPIPKWREFQALWSIWDAVTREMIPDEELLDKPIKLRNACIFYLGHIPTFFDMKLADVTDGICTEPAYFSKIFERGIDPDVENPEHCHAHSEIPDEWPALNEILDFQGRVRERVKELYNSGIAQDPKIGRVLWLGYEHEAMHLETLLYMLIQSEKMLSPPDIPMPRFDVLAKESTERATPNQWHMIPETKVKLGLDDTETATGPSRYFGWDIEKPSRMVRVAAFEAKARPITISEYAAFLEQTGKTNLPASWKYVEIPKQRNARSLQPGSPHAKTIGQAHGRCVNGLRAPSATFPNDKAVRTVYGSIPLAHCLEWPVAASYDELASCAAWMGGRIPTLEEAQSVFAYADYLKRGNTGETQTTIPAVDSSSVNDGVPETPPVAPTTFTMPTATHIANPSEVFVDLVGANVGFQQWHPTAVTASGDTLKGQGDCGGVWEWTSSPLKRHDGYAPMPLYPAYSTDFFDDKHNIVLGGSWATVPRIAGRKSFVNWYQRNYPYVFAGARLVRDIPADHP